MDGEALGPDALAKTVGEQDTAKGDFPSPLLVIARGDFVDELQLAAAAADGAKAVVLDMSLAEADRIKVCVCAAHTLARPLWSSQHTRAPSRTALTRVCLRVRRR